MLDDPPDCDFLASLGDRDGFAVVGRHPGVAADLGHDATAVDDDGPGEVADDGHDGREDHDLGVDGVGIVDVHVDGEHGEQQQAEPDQGDLEDQGHRLHPHVAKVEVGVDLWVSRHLLFSRE